MSGIRTNRTSGKHTIYNILQLKKMNLYMQHKFKVQAISSDSAAVQIGGGRSGIDPAWVSGLQSRMARKRSQGRLGHWAMPGDLVVSFQGTAPLTICRRW